MGTEPGAGPALNADDGFFPLFIKMNGFDYTGLNTGTATRTFIRVELHTSATPGHKGFHPASRRTGGIQTAPADICHQFGLESTLGAYLDRALPGAETLIYSSGTGQHAGITGNTTIHARCLQNFLSHCSHSSAKKRCSLIIHHVKM